MEIPLLVGYTIWTNFHTQSHIYPPIFESSIYSNIVYNTHTVQYSIHIHCILEVSSSFPEALTSRQIRIRSETSIQILQGSNLILVRYSLPSLTLVYAVASTLSEEETCVYACAKVSEPRVTEGFHEYLEYHSRLAQSRLRFGDCGGGFVDIVKRVRRFNARSATPFSLWCVSLFSLSLFLSFFFSSRFPVSMQKVHSAQFPSSFRSLHFHEIYLNTASPSTGLVSAPGNAYISLWNGNLKQTTRISE